MKNNHRIVRLWAMAIVAYFPLRSRGFVSSCLMFAGLACHAQSAPAQTVTWQNNWTYSAPPTLQFASTSVQTGSVAAVRFSPDGEILLSAPAASQLDDQFVRLTSTGNVRWVVNLGGNNGPSVNTIVSPLANADGSAYVVTEDGMYVAKIGATGSVAWTRLLSASQLVAISGQSIAVAGCNRVTALDTVSGQTLWDYVVPGCSTRLIADALGNLYVTYRTSSGGSLSGRVAKIDPTGHIIWSITAPSTNTIAPFGVAGAHLYLTNTPDYTGFPDEVIALNVTDGSTAWTVPNVKGYALVGTPGEPVVISSGFQVERLAANNGQSRWSQSVASTNVFSLVSTIGGDVLVDTTRLNSSTGAIVWSAALPQQDSYGNTLSLIATGRSADGNVIAVGLPQGVGAPPVLQKINFSSGQLLEQVPVSSAIQGVAQTSIAEDDGLHVASAAVIPSPTGGEIHVRRLNNTDGTVAWSTVDTSINVGAPVVYTGVAAGGNTVAVSTAIGYHYVGYSSYGAVLVNAFDRTTGTKRWSKLLYDFGQGYTYAYDPVVDASGNVFVAYGTTVAPCYPFPPCEQQTLVKLATSDGSVVWRFNNVPGAGYTQVFPQQFALVGDDVVIAGTFSGQYASTNLLRLSGENGSLMWSSAVPMSYVGAAFPLEDGTLIVHGDGWAKVDAATGMVSWINPLTFTCPSSVNCYGYDGLVLPSGDTIDVGEVDYQPLIEVLPGFANATAQTWTLAPNDPNLRSIALQIKRDQSGGIWLRLFRRSRHGALGITVLAKLNFETGTLLSQQVLGPLDHDPLTERTGSILLAAPENNQVLVDTVPIEAPLPATGGNSLFDTTIQANGDLTLQIVTDHTVALVGQTIGFQATVSYSGDTPVAGVHLFIGPTSQLGRASSLTCGTVAASNCVIDTRSDTARVSFDIQPGGHATIAGKIVVQPNPVTSTLVGVVHGPLGLNEPNTVNNFGISTILQDNIFANGFGP